MPVLSMHGHNPARYTTYLSGDPPVPIPITSALGQDDHILITTFNLGQPGGKWVLCHSRCDQAVDARQTASGVRLTCRGCKSRCTIPQFKTDEATPLGKPGLVAVAFPPDQYHVQWGVPPPPQEIPSIAIIPPPPRETPRTTILPPPPDAMTRRSISLPSSTTVTPRSSSSSLRIRIPPTASTSGRSPVGRSGRGGTRSTTATPPPPSPQEQTESRKRSPVELALRDIWQKRQKRGEDSD